MAGPTKNDTLWIVSAVAFAAVSSPGLSARIGTGPTLVPGELSATPRFSEQQQRVLRALCRPLFQDGEGINPASDDEIAGATVAEVLAEPFRVQGEEPPPGRIAELLGRVPLARPAACFSFLCKAA